MTSLAPVSTDTVTTAAPQPRRRMSTRLVESRFPFLGLLGVVAGIGAWQLAASSAQNYLFQPPVDVLSQLGELLAEGSLVDALLTTLTKGAIGLVIGVVTGVLVGRLMAASHRVNDAVAPLVSAAYPVPRLAIYPLLVIALGAGDRAAIVLVSVEAFFPILYSTQVGSSTVSQRYRWLMSNVGASYLRREALVARALMPSLMAGLRNAVPTVLIVVVVTELMMGSSGAGFLARDAGNQFEPARALAVVIALGLVGVVLNGIMRAAANRTQSWALSRDS